MQSSRKDRAPLPGPPVAGSIALWPNAIRLRPNEHSSRWATIHGGAKARLYLSRSFGEGLLARMTKDEARARTAFEAARAQQEKIVQVQPDYGPSPLRPRLNRRCSWAERLGVGRRPSGDRAHAGGKRCQQRQSRPSIFRHYSSVGGREGACLAATGSWTACSHRITHAELRRLKTAPLLGPAPRRSTLRENRRLARAERQLNHGSRG